MKSKHVFSLPYKTPFYPDEICGSWFARLKAHNTPYIWNSFLRNLGIEEPRKFTTFDLLKISSNIEKALSGLGVSVEDARQQISTMPYRLSVGASPNAARRGYLPRQFCRQCIRENVELHGEPYWHRAHQLPFVQACHIHHILLDDGCSQCNVKLGVKTEVLVGALSFICTCGADLRSDGSGCFQAPTHLQIRLAELSYKALNRPALLASSGSIWKFLGQKAGSFAAILQICKDRWGEESLEFLSVSTKRKENVASDVLLAMAALDLNFDDIERGLVSIDLRTPPRPQTYDYQALTLANAKAILIDVDLLAELTLSN